MQQSEFPQSGSTQTAPAANCTCASHANSITITDEKMQQLLTEIRSTAVAAKRSGEDAAQKGQRVVAACDILLMVLKSS